MEYQMFTLKNGIRVIHQQVDSPVAHFGVIVNTGSRDEEEHEQGMAHFVEHTIFKGTRKRKAVQIINRLEDVGGEMNAYTTKEETAIYSTFLNTYYSRAIELVSDIVLNASYPDKELALEKDVIIEEINSYNDSPAELIFDEFEELIFDGHPIARNILGTPETVRSFNKEQAKNFIKKNYHTDEMVICSVGKLSPKKFEALIIRYFSDLPENLRSKKRLPFSGYKPELREVEKDTFQSHCIIGAEAYSVTHDLRLPMVLLNNLLGGSSLNSRLNMALREKNGLAYSVESNYSPYSDTGVFMTYFGTERNNLDRAVTLVEKELQKLRAKRLGSQQLARAKKQIIGQLGIANENREDLMLTIGRSYLYFDKVDSLQSVFNKIEAVTSDEIYTIANDVMAKNNLSKLIFL